MLMLIGWYIGMHMPQSSKMRMLVDLHIIWVNLL